MEQENLGYLFKYIFKQYFTIYLDTNIRHIINYLEPRLILAP